MTERVAWALVEGGNRTRAYKVENEPYRVGSVGHQAHELKQSRMDLAVAVKSQRVGERELVRRSGEEGGSRTGPANGNSAAATIVAADVHSYLLRPLEAAPPRLQTQARAKKNLLGDTKLDMTVFPNVLLFESLVGRLRLP